MNNVDDVVPQSTLQANLDANQSIDVVPGANPGLRLQEEIKQRSKPTMEYLGDLWDVIKEDSLTNTVVNAVSAVANSPYDPSFDAKNHKELYSGINPEDQHAIDSSVSYDMGARLHDNILEKYKAQTIASNLGPAGIVPGIVGMLDPINIGAMFVAPEMALANKIRGTGRVVSTARGIVGGAVGAGEMQAGVTLIDPTGHWTDVVDAAVSGGAFGGLLGVAGAFKEDPLLTKLSKDREAFQDHVHRNAQATEDSAQININENPWRPRDAQMDSEGSIGAGYIPVEGERFNPDGVSEDTLKRRQSSRTFLAENGIGEQAASAFSGTAYNMDKQFQTAYDAMMKTPLAPLYERMMDSGSLIARELAFRLGENGSGVFRNNTSGIMLKEVYRTKGMQGISDPLVGYDAAFAKWLRDSGLVHVSNDLTGEAALQIAALNPQIRAKFDREIALRRNQVHLGKETEYDTKPGRTYMNDLQNSLDKDTNARRKILQSEDGKSPVRGSEHLTEKDSRGHIPQHVNGEKMQGLIKSGQVKEKSIIDMFKNSYRGFYSNLSDEVIDKLAKAQVRRAGAFADGIDANMFRMLNQNGELYLRQYLMDTLALSAKDTDRIIAGLRIAKPEADKAGFLRSKRELDWSTPIEGTNLQLVDIMHHDIPAIWNHDANRAAGMAALARHGYQYGDIESLVNNIMEEANASGTKFRLTKDDLLNFVQPFIGGKIYGAPDVWTRRALSAVSTAIYGGVGLAQATETAAGMAAFGMKEFLGAMKAEMKSAPTSTVRQVEHLVAGVRGEEKLFMEKYQFDQFSQDAPSMQELGTWIDRALAAGRNIQGVVTGFFWIKRNQQRAAIRCMLHALDDTFTGVKGIEPARLRDIGMDPRTEERISKYFSGPDAVVTRGVDENGVRSLDLHLERWDKRDELALGAVLNRSVNQIVQKAMLGETTPWMNKYVGSIFMQGKGFTMLSITKQFFRNAQLGTNPMNAALIHGMMLGTAGYIASRVLAADGKGLDPVSIIKGGISNSNMSSWVPAFWDTGAALTGIDALKLSPYNFNPRTDIIGVPPLITSTNSMLHLPFVPLHAMTGTFSNNDVTALKSLPIVGNHILFRGLWNTLKD